MTSPLPGLRLFDDAAALAPPRAVREALPDGAFVLRHPEPLQPYARCIGAWLEHWAQVGRLAQSLLDLPLPAGAPVVVLSDNAVDHALLLLAGMHVGRPVCTVSSAYSRLAKDFAKLHGMLDALAPALVYASDAAVYGPALAGWGGAALRVFSQGAASVPGARHFNALLDTAETPAANHNFNMVLAHGGSLYIDDGRPVPGLVARTVANLREVKPNLYFNVPRGFDMLLPFLEQDEGFAADFFDRLEAVFYAGAALPQSLWQRLEGVARRVRGEQGRRVWFTSAWGATETAPAITSVYWGLERAGCIGGPLPGVQLKFVPNGGKLELRVRGPNVFPGYRNAPDLTAQAFDADGYYLIGDAGRLVDEADPSQGVAFDGRVAEDFKLMSGTWVSVGTLRVRAVTALTPLAADVVVTGHDREEVGLLVFPSAAAQALPPDALAERLRAGLLAMRAEGGGSASTPMRARVLSEPPSVDAGEITDKGYLNQRAVLARRSSEVIALYGNVPDPRTVRL
ncbi:MAG: feruloyl-CoA synthase [Burkholderiales bacterium PBB5]|nr:MAG: feruloyl-CoA synthase [Burkholderiales bacterium PBB5]